MTPSPSNHDRGLVMDVSNVTNTNPNYWSQVGTAKLVPSPDFPITYQGDANVYITKTDDGFEFGTEVDRLKAEVDAFIRSAR